MLVLPAGQAALLAGGALVLDRTGRAGCRPVAAQDPAVFLAGEAVDQALPGRADVDVLLGEIAEVLLAEAALRL